MKKVKFIYNPYSGDKSIVKKIDDIIQKYQKNGFSMTLYRVDKYIDYECVFSDINDGFDHILIAGGDGTINIVVNEILNRNINTPIALLSTGTANDFSKALGMPRDINVAVDNILEIEPKPIDVGTINNKYFINVASAGMFTDVSQKIDNDIKNKFGKVTYYVKGIEEALNMKQFYINMVSDDMCYSGEMYLMLVFNGKTAGNINLAYKSELDDGKLDVIIFKARPIPKTVPLLFAVLRGEHLEGNISDDIIYFKTEKVSFDCSQELTADVDGEQAPKFPLEIECLKHKLSIRGIKKEFN